MINTCCTLRFEDRERRRQLAIPAHNVAVAELRSRGIGADLVVNVRDYRLEFLGS